MPDNLRTMRPRQHWRLAMYHENIALIRLHILEDHVGRYRERDEVLLQGWIELKREFEAELAREEKQERLREVTKEVASA